MSALRFGLVGCGAIARKHATAIGRLEDAELVAACDPQSASRERIAREFDVPTYESASQMLEVEDIDVVCVLTPSGDHAARIVELVRFGKHIVVEKPLALRLEEADEIIAASDRASIRLFVVKQNRFNRPIQALRSALERGRFGKLVLGTVRVRWCRDQAYYDAAPWRGTWEHDGGALTNQASHHIDMIEWMMGDVDSVQAMIATRLAKIEVEDTGVANIGFRNGALGIVEATSATRPKDLEGSLSILGEKGAVVVGGFAMDRLETWQFVEPEPEDETIFETHGENPSVFAWNHTEYLRDVVSTIRTGGKALVDGLEGRRSLELINGIYESAETERLVHLRFRPQHCKLGIPT